MTKYVVRSMSTTDMPECKPYHVYLMPSHKRTGAYWTSGLWDAQRFDTPQEAEAEIARSLKDWNGKPDHRSQIVPEDHRHVPTYWEIQGLNRR
jgi:hypothetical protein